MKDNFYEYERDSIYCYPNSYVLKNKLNIKTQAELSVAEREITAVRMTEILANPLPGSFDFKHLQKIHKALFGDLYTWAGKTRNVNISKGSQFCRCEYIESMAEELFRRLKKEMLVVSSCQEDIGKLLAFYLSEINVIHPFREGNGRAQRVFIEYLANMKGYYLDFSSVTQQEMIEASVIAFHGDYSKMENLILRIMQKFDDANDGD